MMIEILKPTNGATEPAGNISTVSSEPSSLITDTKLNPFLPYVGKDFRDIRAMLDIFSVARRLELTVQIAFSEQQLTHLKEKNVVTLLMNEKHKISKVVIN